MEFINRITEAGNWAQIVSELLMGIEGEFDLGILYICPWPPYEPLELFQALKAKATEILAALDSVEMDFTGSAGSFRYGGGRDLSRLEELAREDAAAGRDTGSGG